MLSSLRMSGIRSELEAETKVALPCLQVEARTSPGHQHLRRNG